MSALETLTNTQKTRAALHRDVRRMSTECCHLLGLDITKEAMEVVAELVYAKILVYGTDLEAFAKHAKRSAVNADDVKLLVRRNPSLKSHISSLPSAQPATKEKRRKTIPAAKQRSPPNRDDSQHPPSTVDVAGPSEIRPGEVPMVVDTAIDLTFDD